MKKKSLQVKNFGFRLMLTVLSLFALGIVPAFGYENDPGGTLTLKNWNVVGPDGGDVRVIRIDPRDKNRLYATTLDGQIHISRDGGKSWQLLVNFNRPQLILDQFEIDLRDSNVLYASGHRHTEPGGFFKSTDAGQTWKETKDLRKESVHAMVQSSFDPNVILAGTVNGVWISNDSGENFKRFDSPTNPKDIDSLAMDPRNLTTIYAGTWWRAYKTTDGGKNWRLIKNGMIDDSDVFAITIDSKNPEHIIASACSGIYESYNGGELWKKVQGIPSQSRRTRDILQHPSRPGTIYAATTEGFWMSVDGGKSWAITTTKNLEINSIAVNPDEPNRVFIGTNNYGIMVSTDGGRNFTQTNDNFTSRFTYNIIVDSERADRLYATTQNTATGGGFLFISTDGGRTWTQNKSLDVGKISPMAILQDRANTNTMYLGTTTGLFRSLDRGLTWTKLAAPKTTTPRTTTRRTTARTTTTKPVTTATTTTPTLIPFLTEKIKVLGHTEDGKNGILAASDTSLYRSYDLSKGWEKISFGANIKVNIFAIHISPLNPEKIWIGTATSGVLVSNDNGKTWQTMSVIPQNIPVSSINSDPNDADKVYVGTSQTFYLSRDGGKSWQRRGGNLPLGNYTSILINPTNTNEIYTSSALESDGGIYYSMDSGVNWRRLDAKMLNLPSRRVWSLTFDSTNFNRIFAGTHSSGVYRIELETNTNATENITRPRISGNER